MGPWLLIVPEPLQSSMSKACEISELSIEGFEPLPVLRLVSTLGKLFSSLADKFLAFLSLLSGVLCLTGLFISR